MASLPKPTPTRRLHELLKEQQEPFLLDAYLLEKGYFKKIRGVESTSKCWPVDSRKNLQCISRKHSKKKGDDIPKCSRLLKSVFVKLVAGKNQHSSNHDNKASDKGKFLVSGSVMEMESKGIIAEPDQFSSASNSTVFDSCINSDTEEFHSSTHKYSSSPCATESFRALKLSNLKEPEAVTDGKLQSGFTEEDCKQLSPVSVLELQSGEGSPFNNHRQFYTRTGKDDINPSTSNFRPAKNVTEESIFSGSLRDFLLQSIVEKQGIERLEFQENIGFGSSSQYLKSKKVLQDTKQLLFDCVREAVETHRRERKTSCRFGFYQPCLVVDYLGPEQLGQIICEQICSWGGKPGDITNINHLLEEDFSKSAYEWSHLSPQIKEIGIEIEDAIFADIKDDLISDLMELWEARKRS